MVGERLSIVILCRAAAVAGNSLRAVGGLWAGSHRRAHRQRAAVLLGGEQLRTTWAGKH